MRAIMQAVAAFLASLPRMVWRMIKRGGRMVLEAFAVPAPAPLRDLGLPSANESRLPVVDSDPYDMEMGALRTVASHLKAGFIPPAALSAEISPETFEWLTALTPSMLETVTKADHAAIRAHIMGRKTSKGVLLHDADLFAQFTRVSEPAVDGEDELEVEGPQYH